MCPVLAPALFFTVMLSFPRLPVTWTYSLASALRVAEGSAEAVDFRGVGGWKEALTLRRGEADVAALVF